MLITKHIFFAFLHIKQIKFYEGDNVMFPLRCPRIGSILNFALSASWFFEVLHSLESKQKQFRYSESKGPTYFLKPQQLKSSK